MAKNNKTFRNWVGDCYHDGISVNIDGHEYVDRVAVIGVHHYCVPRRWQCKNKPVFCLQNHNEDCTAWKDELWVKNEDVTCNLQDEKRFCIKPWIGEEGEKRVKCPNGKKLECETLISIIDHIKNQELTLRTPVFDDTEDALCRMYDNFIGKYTDLVERRNIIWNRILFFNYIQHYTNFTGPQKINLAEDNITKELDEQHFKETIRKYNPSVLIILYDKDKEIYRAVKRLAIGYVPIESCNRDEHYFVLAKEDAGLYIKKEDKATRFIQRCAKEIRGKQTAAAQTRALANIVIDKFYKNKNKDLKDLYPVIISHITDEDAIEKLKDWDKKTKNPMERHKETSKQHEPKFLKIYDSFI